MIYPLIIVLKSMIEIDKQEKQTYSWKGSVLYTSTHNTNLHINNKNPTNIGTKQTWKHSRKNASMNKI